MEQQQTPKRTHMVAYMFVTRGGGNGQGAMDVTLPNGFDGPKTRQQIELLVLKVNPSFAQVIILNVIPYGVM